MKTLPLSGLLAIAVLCPTFLHAADKEGERAARAAREQARKTQAQMRALEAEKAALSEQKSRLESELKAAEERADAAVRRRAALERTERAARREAEDLAERLRVATARVAEESSRGEALARRVADIEAQAAAARSTATLERAALEQQAGALRAALAAARERNERMYTLGFEVIARYEEKGCGAAMLQAEPFTALKRAQIEKMAEQDRDRFERERLPIAN